MKTNKSHSLARLPARGQVIYIKSNKQTIVIEFGLS